MNFQHRKKKKRLPMNENHTPKFTEQWAIVELMGHRKLGAQISEEIIAGVPMLRVDIPETSQQKAFTQYYSASAIYCLTPTTEQIGRELAECRSERPVQTYELRALPEPQKFDECENDEEDDNDDTQPY
jgi:hypothetical protein